MNGDVPRRRHRVAPDTSDVAAGGGGVPASPGTYGGVEPDLGDLIVVLLASTLAGLRDRLHQDGFDRAADLVADLVEAADDYLTARAV